MCACIEGAAATRNTLKRLFGLTTTTTAAAVTTMTTTTTMTTEKKTIRIRDFFSRIIITIMKNKNQVELKQEHIYLNNNRKKHKTNPNRDAQTHETNKTKRSQIVAYTDIDAFSDVKQHCHCKVKWAKSSSNNNNIKGKSNDRERDEQK